MGLVIDTAKRIAAADSNRSVWNPQMRAAFRALDPAALCVVATEGPLSVTVYAPGGLEVLRRIGHNRPVWPARVSETSAAPWVADGATGAWSRTPFVEVGTQVRLWCASKAHLKPLAAGAAEKLALMAEEALGADGLLNGFVDVGPELDFDHLAGELVDIGRRIGIRCWDDDELEAFLARAVELATRIGVSLRDERSMAGIIDRMVLEEAVR